MAFEITGKVIEISPVNQVSDKFKKREFVIEKKETGGPAGTFLLITDLISAWQTLSISSRLVLERG